MQATLDVRALFAASATVFLGLAVAMLLAWRELRRVPGLDRVAASYAALVLGTALLAGRGLVPDLLGIVLANLLVVAGAALVHEGLGLFNGARPSRALTRLPACLSAPAFLYFTYVVPSGLVRTALSSALIAFHLGAAAWTSWHGRARAERALLDRVTGLALGSCAAVYAARTALTARGLGGEPHAGDLPTVAALLLGTLAAVVWTTTLLVNANQRLTAEVAAQKNLFGHLLTIARRAGEGPSLDRTLAETLELARSLTGANGSSLLLVDERGAFTQGIYTLGEDALVVEPSEARSLLQEGLAGWVARARESALVADTSSDPRWLHLPDQDALVRSALSVPILSGTTLSGVLTLVHDQPGRFSDEQRRLIESAGAQVALLLRNAQIADARLAANRRQALLIRVLRVAAERSAAPDIARGAADAIAVETGWAHVAVALPGEDGHFCFHGDAARLADVRQAVDAGVIGRAYTTGRTQHVADVSRDPDYLARTASIRSELAVPLRRGERTLGVLNLESPLADAFSAEDQGLAEALAEAVGLGLENARLTRAREELTRSLVHDLRSPMVSIMGSLSLLGRAAGLTDDDRKLLDMAQRNAQRQADLIEAILEVARLEDGGRPVRPARTSIAWLAADVLHLATPRARTRRIELRALVPEDLPEAWVDPELLARVLENLVGNALKFSPEGAGPVTVGARRARGHIEVRVSDSGPGLDDMARARLFQKFAPGGQRESGSGLGLAFCRLAVEASGGALWLEPGPGAVFAFSLPVAPPPGGTAAAAPAGAPRA